MACSAQFESAEETTVDAKPVIDLKTRFDVREDGGLDIHYAVENRWSSDVYLFNGIWTLNAASQFEPDKEKIYRFVAEDDKLTNLIGIPPLPRFKTPVYQNVPHMTHVPVEGSLEFDVSIAGPIKEYSPYFPEMPDSTYETVRIQKVELKVQYLKKLDGVRTQPSKIMPGFFELISPAALEHVETETSKEVTVKLEVKKRTDDFQRG